MRTSLLVPVSLNTLLIGFIAWLLLLGLGDRVLPAGLLDSEPGLVLLLPLCVALNALATVWAGAVKGGHKRLP